MTKLTIISDTHESHERLDLPGGDILIHCGDFTYLGDPRRVEEFADWLNVQDYEHKVFICGNHELGVERNLEMGSPMDFDDWSAFGIRDWLLKYPNTGMHYLENSGVELMGHKFWGSPCTPTFHDWAFMRNRGADIKSVWDNIPDDTDVLITHGPPYGILDECNERAGCQDLLEAVTRIKPKLHCFGHIHEDHGDYLHRHGVDSRGNYIDTMFINAAIMDESYQPTNSYMEFEL